MRYKRLLSQKGPVRAIRVTLLVDNLADGCLRSEHGLSFLVQTDGGSVLFDTGQTDAWADTFEDEQCLVIRNGDAVGVLVGCAHRGVENNILTAMEIAGVEKIDLLAGGMHLKEAGEERLASLVDFFKDVAVGQIVCCHCTGLDAYKYLRSRLGSKVSLGRAGMAWQI